jgi:hypothetical protein
LPQWAILGLGCGYGLLISVAAFSGRGDATTRWTSALALGAMIVLLVGIGRYGLRKSRFLRSRPERGEREEETWASALDPVKVNAAPEPSHPVEVAISEAMPPTLPGVVRQSELPLERIVPHVDAGILHLQSLLGSNTAGTELEAQLAQEQSRQTPAAEVPIAVSEEVAPAIARAPAANDTLPPEVRSHNTRVSLSPAPASVAPRAIEALLREPLRSQPPATQSPQSEPPQPANSESQRPTHAKPQGSAARAARTLGRARAGSRRSFWKPRG